MPAQFAAVIAYWVGELCGMVFSWFLLLGQRWHGRGSVGLLPNWSAACRRQVGVQERTVAAWVFQHLEALPVG